MNKNIGAMIEKSYRPEGLEEKWYNFWLRNDYFKAESKTETTISRQNPKAESLRTVLLYLLPTLRVRCI
jgi:hypothetical protein